MFQLASYYRKHGTFRDYRTTIRYSTLSDTSTQLGYIKTCRINSISVWICSSANNDKMLQTTSLYTCLFAVINEATTIISAKDKITGNSNVTITTATNKVIFNSTEMNHDDPDTDLQSLCSHLHVAYHSSPLRCGQGELLLLQEYCATFDKKRKLVSIFDCPYFQSNKYRYPNHSRILHLSLDLTQLNKNVCGPLNRKGHLCSECADGFGPSVISLGTGVPTALTPGMGCHSFCF